MSAMLPDGNMAKEETGKDFHI